MQTTYTPFDFSTDRIIRDRKQKGSFQPIKL